ncbi:DNA polymerase IV [Myroides pelagicus]|uniref:DNA polymerase IV n=1 Tax=Myroides pelagicus TaxID=270914 RepID=UPI002DBDC029|nr:DNA polymerase IV [Myroides pelagicus]MEC4113572.1 DNA polymerase IV [Myroides pelagicus]
MERAIAHLDLDTFFVSCERLVNSSLNGFPIIIGGGDRGVVSSCSYEARYFGVRSAMPIHMAMKLCPQALVIKGDMQLYSKMSHLITDIITAEAPVVEKASIDEFYLDLTGMDRFFGTYQWTNELINKVKKESGLPLSYALSINKTVSKIGTGEAKPLGALYIPTTDVQSFLNPLSIQKIPMLGQVTYTTLSRIGIRNIQTLSQMPVQILQQMLGKTGVDIWKKANGIDFTPVEPYRERKSISTEHTFEEDTINISLIKSLLLGMVEKLAFQLRSEQWLTSIVTVKIRYANFDTETKQQRIPYSAADHLLNQIIYELFDKLYQRRMRIRLIGIQFSGLVRGNYQINLFEDTQELMALYHVLDQIKKKYGIHTITRCASATLKHKTKVSSTNK